jgi:hypothetical protein
MFFFSLPPNTRREPETRTLEPAENNPQGIAASVIDLLKCPRPRLCKAINGLHQTESTYSLV